MVAHDVHVTSANDALERNPVKFLLEGQNTSTGLYDWTVVSSGDMRLPASLNSFGHAVFLENAQLFDVTKNAQFFDVFA